MNGSFIYDTNFIIDLLNGRINLGDLAELLNGVPQYVSVITRIELLSFPNITGEEEKRITAFLEGVGVFPLNDQVEEEAIKFRRSIKRKLPDSIIAATAVVFGAVLLTNDSHLLKASWPGLETLKKSG
jgi:predicted nucleic acid-binding protein